RERSIDEQLWANLSFIRSNKDHQYVIDLLEARKDFLRLKRRQEIHLYRIYVKAAAEVGKAFRNLAPTIGELTRSHLVQLERALDREADAIHKALTNTTRESIEEGVKLGARAIDKQLVRAIRESEAPVDLVKLQRGFAEVNRSAVEAFWA